MHLSLPTSFLNSLIQMATETFTALGSGVKVDTEKGIVTLSMLFKWYAGDFGEDESGVLRWITSNADPETREIVSKLLADPKQPPRVEFEPYDWSLNSA